MLKPMQHVAVKGNIELVPFDRSRVEFHVRTTLERGVIENGTFVSPADFDLTLQNNQVERKRYKNVFYAFPDVKLAKYLKYVIVDKSNFTAGEMCFYWL